MKTLNIIAVSFSLFIGLTLSAQNSDQNPNYMKSQTKYMEKADELNTTQGKTIQDTYEAFDWTEYKVQKKQDRKDRRYARYQMRYNYYNGGQYYNGYSNNYNYNSGYNYNNGYNNNYGGGYYNSPTCGTSNVYNSLLLGAALYSIFK